MHIFFLTYKKLVINTITSGKKFARKVIKRKLKKSETAELLSR